MVVDLPAGNLLKNSATSFPNVFEIRDDDTKLYLKFLVFISSAMSMYLGFDDHKRI